MQLTPVLSESVTVQQYLEAKTLRQVQSIKVRQQPKECLLCSMHDFLSCCHYTLDHIAPVAGFGAKYHMA